MQCHNHPWERAEAVAKKLGSREMGGRRTYTEQERLQRSAAGRADREAPGSRAVTALDEGEGERGVSRRTPGSMGFPLRPGSASQTQNLTYPLLPPQELTRSWMEVKPRGVISLKSSAGTAAEDLVHVLNHSLGPG